MSDVVPVDVDAVAARVAEVRDRIAAAGGDPQRVRLVAVTKGFGPDAVIAAHAAGVLDVGEGYAQEMAAKVEALADGPRPLHWHFVGRLQTNKVRLVAPSVDLWQSIDRDAVGDEVAKRSPGARVLVQVNVSGEAQKGGCEPGGTADLVARLGELGLSVAGLMAIGPSGDPEASRPAFRALRTLADDLGLAERSMGMSDDLEIAVSEGATIVRVGRALFGSRPDPRSGTGRMRH
ncbi:MAG TPA: YggS family pyridoxal phosphate-dependent enzyme [Acidimicrobiales bacterium]|nr:YggS family pyridoxal phosphate-dependent enzyme [Acidimicrobiales bacterium]